GVMSGPALVPISSARKPAAGVTAGSSARNPGLMLMRLLSPAPAQARPTKPLPVCSNSPSNDITSVAPPSEFAAVAAVEKTVANIKDCQGTNPIPTKFLRSTKVATNKSVAATELDIQYGIGDASSGNSTARIVKAMVRNGSG